MKEEKSTQKKFSEYDSETQRKVNKLFNGIFESANKLEEILGAK